MENQRKAWHERAKLGQVLDYDGIFIVASQPYFVLL